MLFEKNKENLEITTWYHKSFPSAPRLSELGLEGRETRAGTMRRGYLKLRGILTAAISSETAYPTGEELLFAMDYCMGT